MAYSDQTAEIKYYERTSSHCKSNAKRRIHEPEDNFVLPYPYSLWIDGVFFLNREVGLVIQNWEHLILFIESVYHRAQLTCYQNRS